MKYENDSTSVVYASATKNNTEPTGTFILTKKNADGSKNLQGVKYRIWNTTLGYDKTFTTDANGKIEVSGLKLGTYNYQETQTISPFLLDTKVYTFTLKYENDRTSVVYASATKNNTEPTGTFTLEKESEDGLQKLRGVKYRIWNNEYDKTFTTDENGKIQVSGLKLGTYNYKETETIAPYLLDTKTYTFTLTYANDSTSVVYASATRTNTEPTGTFTLIKENVPGDKKLQGVKYRIWNNGYDKTFTTDANGKIEVTGLKLGTYNYQETQTIAPYLLDTKIYTFTLKYANDHTEVVYASATKTNTEPTGTFTLTKKNAEGTKNLQGVKYRIWNNDLDYDKTFTTNAQGIINVEGLKLRNIFVSRNTNNSTILAR